MLLDYSVIEERLAARTNNYPSDRIFIGSSRAVQDSKSKVQNDALPMAFRFYNFYSGTCEITEELLGRVKELYFQRYRGRLLDANIKGLFQNESKIGHFFYGMVFTIFSHNGFYVNKVTGPKELKGKTYVRMLDNLECCHINPDSFGDENYITNFYTNSCNSYMKDRDYYKRKKFFDELDRTLWYDTNLDNFNNI